MSSKRICILALIAFAFSAPAGVSAQRGRGRGGAPPPSSAREAAPVDFTGTWVSVVTEDWRWRMVTPARGDFASVPLNAEGQRVGEGWDPEADAASGNECKAYGAPGLMRIPGRLRISWEDDDTLRIDADAGTQTRLLHFEGSPPDDPEPSWQGYSAAQWEQPLRGAGTPQPGLGAARIGTGGRALEVVTTGMRSGYLRKNGIPYSENAILREFFSLFAEADGDEWFVVTSIVEDPQYLREPYVTSTNFKRVPDDTGWNPTPCAAR